MGLREVEKLLGMALEWGISKETNVLKILTGGLVSEIIEEYLGTRGFDRSVF